MTTQRGHTLLELAVTLAIAAILAAVVVPGAAFIHGRLAVTADAHRFALVLRRAQARAAATGRPVRVELPMRGKAYQVISAAGGGPASLDRGEFDVPCSTNYPGGALEFD